MAANSSPLQQMLLTASLFVLFGSVLGMKPRTSHMPGDRSTTEPQPQPLCAGFCQRHTDLSAETMAVAQVALITKFVLLPQFFVYLDYSWVIMLQHYLNNSLSL